MLLDKKIPFTYLFGQIKKEFLIMLFYALTIEVLDEYFKIKGLSIPIALPALLGTAISLILGFRLAQAYARWWEARILWGAIVNDTRSLLRQFMIFSKAKGDHDLKLFLDRAMTLTSSWCFCLAHSLKREPWLEEEQFLSDDENKKAKGHQNLPNAILLLLGQHLKLGLEKNWYSEFHSVQIEGTITSLTNSMGGCERIRNTVFPKTYTLVVEFLLYLFVAMLPFGIIPYFGYMEGFIIILISTPFFLLEKSAIHLQDPFSGRLTDTPVYAICKTIKRNLHEMLNKEYTKPKSDEETYYQL